MRSLLCGCGLFALAALALTTQAQDKTGGSAKVSQPFNGKDLNGWAVVPRHKDRESHWTAGHCALEEKNPSQLALLEKAPAQEAPQLINAKGGGVDLFTEAKYGDCRIEIDVMVPKGSNSGIYVMGEYEVQVFDSFGKADDKLNGGDMGAIYSAAVPKINACKKPGEWQSYVIDFQAPTFEDGNRLTKAKFLRVVLNGQTIHENVELNGPTPGGITGKEAPTGPIMFQGDHGPVAYRNIRITPRGVK